MSDNIYFDNILISDSLVDAQQFADETFQLKSKKRYSKEVGLGAAVIMYNGCVSLQGEAAGCLCLDGTEPDSRAAPHPQ